MISAQLEDSCSSEVNEGNRTSCFVGFSHCQMWIQLGDLGNYTQCLPLVLTMNVVVKKITKTMISAQLEDLCSSEVNEGD